MELLYRKGNIKFYIDKNFDNQYLLPVQKFVQWKLESNNWDDYNELFHAAKLIAQLKAQKEVWFDSHIMLKNEAIAGVMFMVGGKISEIEKKYQIENEQQSLLLKYFHIMEKEQGFGSLWLKSVIMPYYKQKLYKRIYINSSHEGSFPFYNRLGKKLTEYQQPSDNDIFRRLGNCFEVRI